MVVVNSDSATATTVLPLTASVSTTSAVGLPCRVKARERIALDISVGIEPSTEPDRIGFQVPAY